MGIEVAIFELDSLLQNLFNLSIILVEMAAAACQATLALPSMMSRVVPSSRDSCMGSSRSRLRPQSVRELFRMKSAGCCRKKIVEASRASSLDVDLSGEAIGDDFYSVLGLVLLYSPPFAVE